MHKKCLKIYERCIGITSAIMNICLLILAFDRVAKMLFQESGQQE